MLETIIQALPLKELTELYHVGTMDINNRSEYTHEGHMGLSVSEFPEEGGMIASLGGDTYELTNDNGLFIDYHQVSEETWEQVFAWGVKEGYVKPHTFFAFDYEDDEWEMILRSTHLTKEEAEIEAEGEHEIFPLPGYAGTDKFAALVGNKQRNDAKLLLTVLVTACPNIDGVLWQDTLDVSRLSAPRAIILNERMKRWNIEEA